jgi:glutathione S-transferase
MKLYDCRMAPNPRRARIFIKEKGLDIPMEEVSILDGANLKPEYLAVNPRGLLPTLELDDGTIIDEVPAICAYLEAQHPDPPLLGTTPLEKAQIISWERHMQFDGMNAVSEFFRNSVPPMAGRGVPGRSGDPQLEGLVERGKRGVGVFYDRLEKRLAESKFVGGEHFSLADITGLCVVDFATFAGFAIPEANQHTRRWHKSVSSRPSAAA